MVGRAIEKETRQRYTNTSQPELETLLQIANVWRRM